jgi:3-methyladenine DNA glycosylase AlkD
VEQPTGHGRGRVVKPKHAHVAALGLGFSALADPARAVAMRAYMQDRFAFFGIASPARRSVQRSVPLPADQEIPAVVRKLWMQGEREFQYAAIDLLARRRKALDPEAFLALAVELARQKSWWDTVDGLASVISDTLLENQGLVGATENWVIDETFWVVRLALLHQNGWHKDTDEDRLFAYCLQRAGDKEFFIRKAIGWALRDYAWTNPTAVEQFVYRHASVLSPLSRREALKNIKRAE